MPSIWKVRPRPRISSLPGNTARKVCRLGSPASDAVTSGADRPASSQNVGITLHVELGTQPCAIPPQEFHVIVQFPELSALACTFVGAAGPSGPVVIWTGSDG